MARLRPDGADAPVAGDPRSAVKDWLGGLARANRRWMLATVAAGLLAGVATVVQMALLALVIHRGVVERVPYPELGPLFVGLLLALAVRAIGQGLQSRWAARSSERVGHDVRHQLQQYWQASGPVALGQSSAGTLAREWLDHVDALHGYFARYRPQMYLAVILPVLILVLVFWLDWLAGVFLLLSAPLIPLFMALVGMGAERLNRQHFETISRLSGQFLDKVRGLTTLQLFGQTASAAERMRQRSDEYRRITLKTLRVAFLSSAVLEFFASVAIAVIAIYIGFGLLGYITYGPSESLTLFSGLLILLLAPEFFQPLRTLSQHYHDRAAALGAGAEILARLNGPADRPVAAVASAVAPDRERIEVASVYKSWSAERPVLSSVSLTIQRGEVVVLTGPSGGGKSTLLHLLAGFVAPDRGSVSVFGEAPGYRRFGWLGQRGFLVQGTWADNLRLTAPGASQADMRAALEQVGLDALLASRSEGLDSRVSEDGQGLSGGQARRLSLARLFLADDDLILLDECTAGLDRESERVVIAALAELASSGKTLVVASHQPAVLDLADRVLHVSEGRVQDA